MNSLQDVVLTNEAYRDEVPFKQINDQEQGLTRKNSNLEIKSNVRSKVSQAELLEREIQAQVAQRRQQQKMQQIQKRNPKVGEEFGSALGRKLQNVSNGDVRKSADVVQ